MTDEWTQEDEKEFSRQISLYNSLSESDKRFIVSQWDFQNGLKSWTERLQEKETEQERNRTRAKIITLGVIGLLVLGFFIGEEYWRGKGAREGYRACRSNLEVAMEEYPLGLKKKVLEDLETEETALRELEAVETDK